MNIIADLHTHTMVSNHAFNTITEMMTQAKKQGLFAMAMTDHAPCLLDSPHVWYFHSLHVLPAQIDGVWLLKGVELNVLDAQGTLDFTQKELHNFRFDWTIVSIHGDALQDELNYDSATHLWLAIAQNPCVDMIGHSESKHYAYDYDLVTRAFTQHNKVVEINANSALVRPGSEENMRMLALACKKNGTKIAVNSDAHSIYSLGCVQPMLDLLTEIEFPEAQIINASKENFIAHLQSKGKKIANSMEEA